MATNNEIIRAFPAKRLHPIDGLAVTATIWGEAHAYHRLREVAHNRLAHGPGILVGLEVIASDPPDSSVYILPGLAVAPTGEIIIVEEPVAYSFGSSEGNLQLLLTYGESQPRVEDSTDEERLYIHAQFGVEAQPLNSGVEGVELARVRRRGDDAPITDPDDPEQPAENEIDLRFRRELTPTSSKPAHLGVVYLGEKAEAHGQGVRALGQALRAQGTPLWVDDDLGLDGGWSGYTLLYVVGRGAFEVSRETMTALYDYLQEGGSIFMESCGSGEEDTAAAFAAFQELLDSLGIQVEPVERGNPLLNSPHIFATPPQGCASPTEPLLLAGEGVLLSRADYGCLWQGGPTDNPAERESIRAAQEIGANIVTHAVEREERTPEGGEES
ncbi:MAG: DUF4159 domain-containing protein [Anaerolineales bacterium]